ncbi:MAG: TldD/PmbA family protein [Acidobacteria bacterium]|nr:TldD/PmbA family protein [Acidobacteriota bacterium]
MPFSALDTAAVARALSQLAEQSEDLVDVFLERSEVVLLPPDGDPPGFRVTREEGLAVRLSRGDRTWLAARDGIEPRSFSEALRQVARVLPAAAYPEPRLDVAPWEGPATAEEMATFGPDVQRLLRQEHVAFPLRMTVSRHRRWLQVVGVQLVPGPQRESFYSCVVELPWGRFGALLPAVDRDAARWVARQLLATFRARQAQPPEPYRGVVVLGPAAAAVLLHEAVAHALEADTLALGGRPEAAVGVRLGAPGLHILDDPNAAPEGVRRSADDEGVPTCRRWLLRDGVVEQPLADSFWARASGELIPGAARRGNRFSAPAPRSSHLEVLPGELSAEDLVHDADGLYLGAAERGSLDPLTGEFTLVVPHGRRIRRGEVADPVGRCRLRGFVGDLLGTVQGIGKDVEHAGAGWCAKGGQKMPVWASTPALRLEGVEVLV